MVAQLRLVGLELPGTWQILREIALTTPKHIVFSVAVANTVGPITGTVLADKTLLVSITYPTHVGTVVARTSVTRLLPQVMRL